MEKIKIMAYFGNPLAIVKDKPRILSIGGFDGEYERIVIEGGRFERDKEGNLLIIVDGPID